MVEAVVRSARLPGALRRHRQLVRCLRRCDDEDAAREQGAELAAHAERGAGAVHPGAMAGAQPAGAEVREAVPAAVPAARPQQRARREQAIRGPAAGQGRHEQSSSSSAWKSCAATGPRSRSRCSASCISGCSPISRVDAYLPTSCGASAAGALDDALVYRKNLRKRAQEYTATTPPHVAAARKSAQPPGALDQLRHDDCRARADGQHPASARSRALRRQAGQAGRRAGARDARPRFRAW